jgi:long-chain acyl-CoA synthetase
MNIADNLETSAEFFPDHPALMAGGRVVSYSEFSRDTSRVAAGLVSRGLLPGDPVALCAPNSIDWLTFYFGALKAGAVAVTFSHLLTAAETTGILRDCKPRFIFTSESKRDDLNPYCRNARETQVVSRQGDVAMSDLLKHEAGAFVSIDRSRDDTAAILYTGGTTGTPKGAMLSHANIQASAFNVAHYERSTQSDRALCFLPLNHVFAQIHIVHSTVLSGGGLVIQPSFDLDDFMHAIASCRVTKLYAVPTIYIRLLALDRLKEKLATVRYCFSAAASMATEIVKAWRQKTGLKIYEAYGMTESASMVTYNHYHRHVTGSVGTVANLVEVIICDLEGHPQPCGEQGEICIKGPNMTRGYLNHPEETLAAFRDGWFRSGDIGYLDEKGYLFIVDRLKDMVITGGENVYPREVEEVLYTHPQVQECAVVGLPDPEYGERVTAFIVPVPSAEPDAVLLKTYCKKHLAGFKVPKSFHFVDDLPKNNAGKLLKREIRKQWRRTDSQ